MYYQHQIAHDKLCSLGIQSVIWSIWLERSLHIFHFGLLGEQGNNHDQL